MWSGTEIRGRLNLTTTHAIDTITMAEKDSIWNRKRDLVYLVFFLTHIPVMLGKFGGPARQPEKEVSTPKLLRLNNNAMLTNGNGLS